MSKTYTPKLINIFIVKELFISCGLIFLLLSACSEDENGGYEGQSAWQDYQNEVRSQKRVIGNNSTSYQHNGENSAIKEVLRENYISAIGAKCTRVRNMVNNKLEGSVKCQFANGKEIHYNDLTL